MATSQSFEEQLEELGRIARLPLDDDALSVIRRALGRAHNILVARAADIVADNDLNEFTPQLIAAFGRFMKRPVATDKGCEAKVAIVKALRELRAQAEDVFLAGARHIQKEAAWGEPIDTADRLRVESAMALVVVDHPEAGRELTRLLVDREPRARIGAVQALAVYGGEAAEMLLRHKLFVGDAESEVVAECFVALMGVAPEASLPLVASHLKDDDLARAEDAALALGVSRDAGALAVLCEQWRESADPKEKSRLALPVALNRSDEAFEFLLAGIGSEHEKTAIVIVEACKVCATDEARRRRVQEAVDDRRSRELARAFMSAFGPGD